MRTKLGTFQHEISVMSADGQRTHAFDAWVDTGAHYSQIPASVLANLGYHPNATRQVLLADGSLTESPIGAVMMQLNGEIQPVLCLFAKEGADPLLGATSLENFSLAADPVNKTLIPVRARQLLARPIEDLEEGADLTLDFDKLAKVAECDGVLPCAVQNADTREVILVAYVNELALKTAIDSRSAVFWSTSRNELWEKGKTSGETFDLLEVRVNCEQNSLLYLVRPRRGGICHTKNQSGSPRDCFYRRIDFSTWRLENLDP